MAQNRLTNPIRNSIVNDLIVHAFLAQAQAQVDAECLLTKDIWDNLFGDKQTILDSAPEGWFGKGNSFKIAVDNSVTQLNFSDGLSRTYYCSLRSLGVSRDDIPAIKMPHNACSGACLKNYEPDSSFGKRLIDLGLSRGILIDEIDKNKRTAEVTLNSVSSISKLIDIWPECALFAEPYRTNGEQKALLPAIPRAELNSALRLPPTVNGTATVPLAV